MSGPDQRPGGSPGPREQAPFDKLREQESGGRPFDRLREQQAQLPFDRLREQDSKVMERPHPLTPLIRGWVVLVGIVVYIGKDYLPGQDRGDLAFAGPRLIFAIVGAAVVLAAVAGFVTWYFTRFVIDDTELRIESGALVKRSRKVAYERVQSVDIIQRLAARVFGLAELRIEVGAGDSTLKIGYLRRQQADRLRNFILERAHGRHSPTQSSTPTDPGASAFTDLDLTNQKLVTVTPQRLVASFVLSVEWLFSLIVVLGLLIGFGVFGRITLALPLLIPFAIGLVTLISNRLINMFNFTLAESPRGFRVVRGLTNLTSQSIPIDRIQGVRISQSFLWKRFGWFRVDVNVLGVHHGDSEDNERSATSVLLPVADPGQLRLVLDRILPGLDLDQVPLQSASPRVKGLRWFDYWTLHAGYDERVVVSDYGWMTAVRDIVPHAKVQSVRLEQGPLQRRLDVAHVHFDLTPGPVTAIARHLPAAAARALALTELDRMRAARAPVPPSGVTSTGPDPTPAAAPETPATDPGTQTVLNAFGIAPDAELGRGGEAVVYGLDGDRVLRLYRGADATTVATTNQLGALYAMFADSDFLTTGVVLPRILDAGWIGDRWSSIDRRLPGRTLSQWLAEHVGPEHEDVRRAMLRAYLDATETLRQLPSPAPGFSRLVGAHTPQTFGSLAELLTAQMSAPLERSFERLEADVPGVEQVWDDLQDALADLDGNISPALVHGDICPGNVFIESHGSGTPRISAIADFSAHTLHADPVLDLVGAAAFVELESYPEAAADSAWLGEQLANRLGPGSAERITAYRRYYAFYFSDTAESDPTAYAWCVRQLRDT